LKVIVCGGRDFKGWKTAKTALDFWLPRLPITAVIQGGQVSLDPAERHLPWEQRKKWGADYIAKRWAELRGIPVIEEAVSAEEWKKLGGAAGPIRNRKMLDLHKPQAVISFEGGSGTADMLRQARARGIKCIEVS